MVDKLIFKGGRTVINRSGNSLQLINPARGRSLHRFPRWWNKKPSVVYIDCAIIRVTFNDGSIYRLVIPASGQGHILEIRHDGNGNFTFPTTKNIERCALVSEFDTTLFVEYQFSKISGGSVLKRTVKDFPQQLQIDASPEIAGDATEGQKITLTPAQTTGGIDVKIYRSCLQTKDKDKWTNGKWGDSKSSVTYLITKEDIGKTFRYYTEIVDAAKSYKSYSEEVGPVQSAQGTIQDLVDNADPDKLFVVETETVENEDVFVLNGVVQPTIEFNVGETVVFDMSGPEGFGTKLAIYTDADKTVLVTVGIEFNDEYLTFTPPIPGTFSYQSANDSAVGGDIIVSSSQAEDSQ